VARYAAGVKFLHVTDTHLGADRWFVGAPRGWRRAQDHLSAFKAAVAPALRGEVDLVIHTGDLFDRSRPPARVVAEARDLLAEIGRAVPVVVMPGNHDRRGLVASLGNGLPGVQVWDVPALVKVAGLRFGVLPWMSTASNWAAAARAACAEGVDFLLAHQAVDGCHVGRYTFRVGRHADTIGPQHIPAGVRTLLSGHIHPRQSLRCGETSVIFPGSSERTSFAEVDEIKSAVAWDMGAEPRWRWMPLPVRSMHVLTHPSELHTVEPQSLVRITGEARTRSFEREVLAAGAWVEPWKDASRQLPLFAPA
jgi:DNA repair protein SbcD/Mre11